LKTAEFNYLLFAVEQHRLAILRHTEFLRSLVTELRTSQLH